MTPTYSLKPGRRRYRYYASPATFRGEETNVSIPRVPAVPLENLINEVLTRLRLPPLTSVALNASVGPTTFIVSRVDLRPKSIALCLNRDVALRSWRASYQGLNDPDLISLHASGVARGETLSDHKDHLVLTLPVRARFRGGRAGMIIAPGSALRTAGPDKSLIKALARAHRWKAMLISGDVTSIEALARRVGQERRHVGRTLALAFLSPAITKAIVTGQQPAGLRLSHLLDADIPLSWRDQQAMVERLACAAG